MSKDQTSSFVLRFTQKIFDDTTGESNIQWRGKISHVQGGDQKSFSEFDEAIKFMQTKLSEMTEASVADKPQEEKDGLISKSFDIWKKVAKTTPKMVLDVLKDPKGQVSQIQEQISTVGDELSQKIELDDWKMASKTDYKNLLGAISKMQNSISDLTEKVDKLTQDK